MGDSAWRGASVLEFGKETGNLRETWEFDVVEGFEGLLGRVS